MPKGSKEKWLSSYQMIAYAKNLHEEVKKMYDDVKLTTVDDMPFVSMPEGNYMGMWAITVLENLKDDVEFYEENEEDEENEE
jgi:hypothetical protein